MSDRVLTVDPRVIRPSTLEPFYAYPDKEARRLATRGVLLRVAHGYYVVVPERLRGTDWRPAVEAVGLGIGQRDYGVDGAVAMGISAARLLGAIPRALGIATIAIERWRPPLDTAFGRVRFVTRELAALDVQRAETELCAGWTTTTEQTALDLADRPELGDLPPGDVSAALRRLGRDLDWDLVAELARGQHKRPAAVRAARVIGAEPPVSAGRRVSMRGLSIADPMESSDAPDG